MERLGHRARRVLLGRKVLRVILVRKGLPDPQGRKAIKERPGQAANCASWSARKKSPAMKVRRWCQLFARPERPTDLVARMQRKRPDCASASDTTDNKVAGERD